MRFKNRAKKLVLLMPLSIRRALYKAYNWAFVPGSCERRVSYGSLHPDKTFYVIRPRQNTVEGLMSLFLYVIQQIDYAEKKKYIPVVDFKNFKTQYTIGDQNDWEVFFKPICNISLDDVYQSKNVILSGADALYSCYKGLLNRSFSEQDLNYARNIIEKYIQISDIVKERYELEYLRISPFKCLGLYLRGTDYFALKPSGEFVQPSVKEIIDYIEGMIDPFDYDNIFLVTEDYGIYSDIQRHFGNKLILVSYDSFIKAYNKKDFLCNDPSINELSKNCHERGINYLVKILLLSNCKYIVGGMTCGSWAACAMAEGKEIHVINKGVY